MLIMQTGKSRAERTYEPFRPPKRLLLGPRGGSLGEFRLRQGKKQSRKLGLHN